MLGERQTGQADTVGERQTHRRTGLVWEILLKEKGGQEGSDQPLGTGTEEEEREIQREKGRIGRNRWSFACEGPGYACLAHRNTLQGPQGTGPGVPGC